MFLLLQDFNTLGLGLDDLIEAYLQTALAVIAIDKMCASLIRPEDGSFDLTRFRALNADDVLVQVGAPIGRGSRALPVFTLRFPL